MSRETQNSSRRRGTLGCAMCMSLLLIGGNASAQAVPCSTPILSVLLNPADPRRALVERLREHLRALSDVDRCAHVTLRAHGSSLLLEVQSGDGRAASRTVQNEGELLRASEALLTLPPDAKPAPSPKSHLEMPPDEPPPAAPGRGAHLEFGVGAAARLGGPPLFLSAGLAGFADIVQSNWLVEVSAKGDVTGGRLTEPTLADYYLASTGVGVGLGRRFEFQSALFDTLVGSRVVLETQDADDGSRDLNGSAADFRVGLTARMSGPRWSALRAFGSFDFEASPVRLGKTHFADPSLPPFPSWSCGLSIGMVWTTAVDGLGARAAARSAR